MPKLIDIQLIESETTKGKGVENDPVRKLKQYWTTDGQLLIELDTYTGELRSELLRKETPSLMDSFIENLK